MIARDGAKNSLWQTKSVQFFPQRKADTNVLYDVIIVGGGITGVATALSLQQKGKRCIILEAQHLCFGTTGGTTAHINTLLDTSYKDIIKDFNEETAQHVYHSCVNAVDLIKKNVSDYGIDCGFEEVNAHLFAQTGEEVEELNAIQTACAQVGMDVSTEHQLDIPISCIQSMRAGGQAKFNPTAYVFALAQAFEELGGTIVHSCRVTDVDVTDDIVAVLTNGDMYRGKDLVYATHSPPGVNLLHLRLVPYRSYALSCHLQNGHYPLDLFYDMKDPYHYYRTQIIDGEPHFIAGGFDHKTGQEVNTDHPFKLLEAFVRQDFDVASIEQMWSSQYYETTDGLPYIGPLPGFESHIYVATGFGGNGMTYSHVAAQLLTNWILNVPTPYATIYDPSRVKPMAGFKTFVKHNVDAVKNLLSKILPPEHLEQLAELAPGEAKIVMYEGVKLALYKNDVGKLHALEGNCKHLGCELTWNSAERSWDCSCHGTRYNFDGLVMNTPSTTDLRSLLIDIVEKEISSNKK
ncbi:hypothetical protein LX64_00307 [Chitinophaga skermanii]|uniref:Rieske domain-containing protein n=1 Tax=Chitinophaga skermanii TaxID=331697 RepID=A0A327R238_9BACT|nr:FAD-dependent oxidoreductase [Chitinophaga skermanii]RAJ10701.1 hypothetical protein LX64_00307 [Chitinophaga skermanii]